MSISTPMEPIERTNFGTKVKFAMKVPFTSDGGVIVDPDEVVFAFSIDGITPVGKTPAQIFTYAHDTGDTTGTIIKVPNTVGLYYARIGTGLYLPGVWKFSWQCRPTNLGYDTTQTEVVWYGQLIVDPEEFPIS